MKSSIGFAVGILAVWWFCSWRIKSHRVIPVTEFRRRLRECAPAIGEGIRNGW